MTSSWFVSLREGIAVGPGAEGELVFQGSDAKITFKHVAAGLDAVLEQLTSTGATTDSLAETLLRVDGPAGLPRLYYYLDHLTRRGMVLRSAHLHGKRLATLTPISGSFVLADCPVTRDRHYALSRFGYMHRQDGEMVVESPLSHARLTLHDWRAAALLHLLAQPRCLADIDGQIPDMSGDAVEQLLTLMLGAQIVQELDDNRLAEDVHSALQVWEFHDLLFHARSREGRHDYPVGGTYRFAGRLEPPPALKAVEASEVVDLHEPDLHRLRTNDPPFAHVQEARRSIREYDDAPIDARQLGEFLYRVARVREHVKQEVSTPDGALVMDFTSRPYPGGGALYELELYVVVNLCRDLDAGLYHYNALTHRLEKISGKNSQVEQLLQSAAEATAIAAPSLQILIIITASFQRVAWKYSSIAYAAILKHVGVLYQTMYLAATAMGLAPCAIGSGNSDLFHRAAGTDYYTETSVGEFLLGSRRNEALERPMPDNAERPRVLAMNGPGSAGF